MHRVLFIHGLNLNPEVWKPFSIRLSKAGYKPLIHVLAGHETLGRYMPSIQPRNWELGLAQECRRLDHGPGPFSIVAFSTGAIVALATLLHTETFNNLSSLVLFSPAICLRRFTLLSEAFRFFPSAFPIPSLSPRRLRAHSTTSASAYNELHRLRRSVQSLPNYATKVFLSPRDELIDLRKSVKWLNATSVKCVQILNANHMTYPHHLTIHPSSYIKKIYFNQAVADCVDFLGKSTERAK